MLDVEEVIEDIANSLPLGGDGVNSIPFNSPEELDAFCYRIDGVATMREISLIQLYRFGKIMSGMSRLDMDMDALEAWVMVKNIHMWLERFHKETKGLPLPGTFKALTRLNREARNAYRRLDAVVNTRNRAQLTDKEKKAIRHWFEVFEDEFEHESRRMPVFGVTKKGDRDVRIVLRDASEKFLPPLLKIMPQTTIDDLREAGRCLVFERATACAFHACRATEGLMRAYYKKLTGNTWPPPKMNPSWKVLVDQLNAEGAPKRITQRLEEIREDRNSFAHPDVTVPLNDGPLVYDLCTNVMTLMAEEMIR